MPVDDRFSRISSFRLDLMAARSKNYLLVAIAVRDAMINRTRTMRENRVIGAILSSRRSEAGETPFSRRIGNAVKPKKWQANSVSKRSLHRREFIRRTAAAAVATLPWPAEATIARARAKSTYQLASFTTDVTPPLGHALMGGGIAPAQRIDDPLFAHGFVLSNGGNPIVFVAVDWCEIRNDAYDRWRAVLAKAARTTRERVLATS